MIRKQDLQDEAYEAIKNSSIPVYTLAALPVQYSKEQNEFGKELGSFARMSAGGQYFMPVEDGTDGTYVGNGIVEDMRQGLILTLDISDAAKERKIPAPGISRQSRFMWSRRSWRRRSPYRFCIR